MKKSSLSKMSIILIATVLLWIKTYIVYKTSFDIKIESWKQEFILFINPLSFLLIVFGIALFIKEKRRNRYILITSFIVSFILFANVMYYREFTDFITIPLLFQANNLADLGNSIFELLHVTDILMFVDVLILYFIMRKNNIRTSLTTFTNRERRAYFLMVAAVVFFNLGLAETERPQLLTRTFDREMLVKNIGSYNYHIYDLVLTSKTKAQRAFADSSEFVEIENYLNANYTEPDEDLFGVAKDRNVIMVSMESLQSFVINETINGEEITPFLNDLIEESYYFDNFYHQTGQGKTSDGEFLVENSLYPLGRGAVFFTNAENEFRATPEILKEEEDYYSAVFHANNKSFWNRDVIYPNLGYDRYFSLVDYDVNEENSIGWGLKDIEFFDQSVEKLKTLPQPFYTKFITLTNHFPFELDEEDKMVDEFTSNSRTLNRYFPTVRYMDESLKSFVEQLKQEGLYENSILVFYGDHYGISENHNKAMGEFLEKDITPLDVVQLQKVPFIVHIPGVTDKNPEVISKVSGQLDVKPTLLHLLGIDTKDDVHFGSDIFSEDKLDFIVLRDGSFITEDYVYTKSTCYDKETGEETDGSKCEPYEEKAKQELEYSDNIVYGDLLRFYEGTSYNENLTEEK
ncbi:LTA synthase family protein [Cytobacillus sp. IB215665]|uniref:LTA synthase family protein n=1 Tax=Cytobacillus sp. IB215665 TaxID=3097357 RepID=UPI002A149B87|nr:LTA synthase family protein [Cytobacillus sp. IB215665]MDX8364241.1 LTA synthase family protein [Cytobacillus sp. IB215665]